MPMRLRRRGDLCLSTLHLRACKGAAGPAQNVDATVSPSGFHLSGPQLVARSHRSAEDAGGDFACLGTKPAPLARR